MTSGSEQVPRTRMKPQSTLTVQVYLELTQESDFYRLGDWREESLCVQLVERGEVNGVTYNREDWFPAPTGRGNYRATTVPEKVRKVCLRCPVRLECLTYAIQTNVVDGIWAGHTFKTVRKIRRRMIRHDV